MSTLEFNDALLRLEHYLRAFAMTYTKNENDARDLTQETMLKALTYRNYYTPQTNFKAWVFTIMRNIFINNYRRSAKVRMLSEQGNEGHMLGLAAGSHTHPENHLLGLELNQQISKLPEEFHIPFTMHVEGFKYQEIAEKLDIPVGTVKSRIFIARKKLMNQLTEN